MSLKSGWEQFRKAAWDNRPSRDRRALSIAAAVLAPTLAYFVLWEPAHAAVARLQAQLPEMRMQSALMKREATEIEALRQKAKPSVLTPAALQSAIESAANELQVRSTIESIEPVEPNGVRITFSSVPYAQWLNLVRHLQQEQHIRVHTVGIVALQTEGMVKITATLVNGGDQ